MMTRTERSVFGKNFTLSQGLWFGFCATFMIVTKAVLRLHLHVTGHAMFFFLLGKGSVPKRGAATFIGFVADIPALMLGMGKDGPLVLLKYVIAGVIIDVACASITTGYRVVSCTASAYM